MTNRKFVVSESGNEQRWPDDIDDYYQIRLPYLSELTLEKAALHAENNIDGVSAAKCGIGCIVTPRSPQKIRRAIEQIARYFRREFDFDFCQYGAEEISEPQEHRAYFWLNYSRSDYTSSRKVIPLIGACCFRRRNYKGQLPPGFPLSVTPCNGSGSIPTNAIKAI
jgi:hypothetical protein